MAAELNKEILIEEDLRERLLSGNDFIISKEHFIESKRRVFEDPRFSFPGGESSEQAQARSIKVLSKIMDKFTGKRIVVGTHGDIMTLMMNYFDTRYNFDFWRSTTMPDIYKLELEGKNLMNVMRLWNFDCCK